MRLYPVEYTEAEILADISKSLEALKAVTLTKEAKDVLSSRIQIGQAQLFRLQQESQKQLVTSLINDNRRSAKVSFFLSIVVITITLIACLAPLLNKAPIAIDELEGLLDRITIKTSPLSSDSLSIPISTLSDESLFTPIESDSILQKNKK